jgi:transposase
VGKTKRSKGTKWMVLVDGESVPLGALLASATPHEVGHAEATLAQVKVPRRRGRPPRTKPRRIIADKAYDSDPLRRRWKQRGIELIASYRWHKKEKTFYDGRKLRRYKRRWKVDRTNAWFGNYRRLAVRYDRLWTVYQGFFHVACLMITVRHFGVD